MFVPFGSFQSDSLSSLCSKLHWWNIIEDLGEGEAGELVRGFKKIHLLRRNIYIESKIVRTAL